VTTDDPIRVLIVDDQHLVRTGFRLILAAEPDVLIVGEAADGKEAVSLAESVRPDVVLMDVRMPRLDGISATRAIVGLDPAPRVVILTTFDLDEHVYAALEAGASGFLLKDVKADVLADAIRTVHRGDALLAPSVTRRLVDSFVASRPRKPAGSAMVGMLTEREQDVLREIGRGLSNAEIAGALFVSEATVKTHVRHVFAKLELRDRAQAVIAAYEAGLVVSEG
jgi:DNA-binding NarL/FixJ family response regulator